MTYFGKWCPKHPELSGERYKDGHCVECTKERVKGRRSDPARVAAWAKANPAKVRASKDAWRKANRAKVLLNKKKWRDANRPKLNAYDAAREARKRKATGVGDPEFNALVFAEAYALASARAQSTGLLWDVDHIVPLCSAVVCGIHTAQNIAVIPAYDNRSKSNRFWPDMP